MTLPNKSNRYRPKSDRLTLTRAITESWDIKIQEFLDQYDELISSAACDHLKSMYLTEDLIVLQKYNVVQSIEKISIRVYNHQTERWDVGYSTNLPHSVLATTNTELTALRPDWYDDPLLGINPTYKERMSVEEWNDVLSNHQKRQTLQLPRTLDFIFEEYVKLANERSHDCKISNWIDNKKKTDGVYPTWEEILFRSPVLHKLES